ncbi:vacuolar import and degradation protein-domain-containing protein [Dichotomopilus funicola]|uniref:Vacuolar import and degradation protein-domain-containing protein n=1 Tax=Dichotomopilus funicola TaxID=1934379 RepID=A0AAN6ZPI0_9PEZI|nr:vacuolar import and degradation protein-domain-containing protein [Dichotomopilus funicola]
MPTPSSNRPDPPSPRFSFTSCPDIETDIDEQLPQEQQTPAAPSPQTFSQQDAHPAAVSSPDSQSSSAWQRHYPSALTDPADQNARPGTATSGESRPSIMSPGSQQDLGESIDPHMRGSDESEVISTSGDNNTVGERYKPAETDEEMSPSITGGTPRERAIADARRASSFAYLGSPKSKGVEGSSQNPNAASKTEAGTVGNPLVGRGPRWVEDSGLSGLGLEYSHMRIMTPAPSLYLHPGTRYVGTQTSERQRYDVEVEIKHVDMRESFMCGYLKIQGLSDDHPTLTTYFEGEMIGPKYGFITQHEGWGATEKIDLSHWSKFTAFNPPTSSSSGSGQSSRKIRLPSTMYDLDQRENIFMRWKEHFLVPDHRVRTISGASFEGFYYICFNQAIGEISGVYFHSKSEKFQRLELKYVPNRGCFGDVEFR